MIMTTHSDVKNPDSVINNLLSRVGYASMLDFLTEVNLGYVTGHSMLHKFGRNSAAGTSNEDVMYGGGILVPLTAAVTMEAISTDAADAAAGVSARTIQIWGVDGSFNEITEIISMNGTSASIATTQLFLRVYRSRIKTVGTYNASNAGEITVRVSGAGAAQLIMETNTGVSQTSHYTIAAGYTGYLLRASLDVDSAKTSRFILSCRENSSLLVAPFDPHQHVHTWAGLSGLGNEEFKANHKFIEKTDVWFECIAGAINTELEVDYDLLIVKDGF